MNKMTFPSNQQIVLENQRVRLEPIHTLLDAKPLEQISLGHPELLQYSPSEFHTPSLFQQYFETAIKGRESLKRYPFIIYDKASQSYAGSTSYGDISLKNEIIQIGWTWIGQKYQRTGLNRHMKMLMLQYAFENLHCKRLELKADARNMASRKAMEGIGAKYEGCLRSHTVMSDGYRRDTVYFSILLEEWPLVKKRLLKKLY